MGKRANGEVRGAFQRFIDYSEGYRCFQRLENGEAAGSSSGFETEGFVMAQIHSADGYGIQLKFGWENDKRTQTHHPTKRLVGSIRGASKCRRHDARGLARRSRQEAIASEGGKEADGTTASKQATEGERLDVRPSLAMGLPELE